MTPPRIVALDLSLAATGVAWTCDHHGRPNIGCRTVHTRRNITGAGVDHQRVRDVLVDVAAAAQCNPHIVVVEGLYVGQNNNTLPLAGLHAVVTQWLYERGVPYAVVAPSTVKVYAAGRGNATKRAVQEAVTATYGRLCHIGDNNQADAMALLAMGCDAYGAPLVEVPASHRRALASVTWPEVSVHG